MKSSGRGRHVAPLNDLRRRRAVICLSAVFRRLGTVTTDVRDASFFGCSHALETCFYVMSDRKAQLTIFGETKLHEGGTAFIETGSPQRRAPPLDFLLSFCTSAAPRGRRIRDSASRAGWKTLETSLCNSSLCSSPASRSRGGLLGTLTRAPSVATASTAYSPNPPPRESSSCTFREDSAQRCTGTRGR